MNWFNELVWGNSIAHGVMLIATVIVAGIAAGKIKVKGVSLGITFVLFAGIAAGHLGLTIDEHVLHFCKEFGLILFVYSIGMQVGPGFFSSFGKSGITLNMLATGVVALGVITTLAIHFITGIPIATMVGIMSGAVTNTPGLGAAQQAYNDIHGAADPTIALGYAVAYPLGVVGIIASILFVKTVFKIKLDRENQQLLQNDANSSANAKTISLKVENPAIFNKSVAQIAQLLQHSQFVISRIQHHNHKDVELVDANTTLQQHDKIFVITNEHDAQTIQTFIGEEISMERNQWITPDSPFLSRRILITKSNLNGKRLVDLNLRKLCGVTITRVNRSGVDFVASPHLTCQVGDRVTVVGTEAAIHNAEAILGNSLKRLKEPNLITIFVGIALGILLGSIPFTFPGIPQPVKLGLAGGPLIVAILVSRFGYKYKLVTYTTMSANLMLREIGITLFLACVGIGAGEGFVETITQHGGLAWIGYGVIITTLPLLIIGTVGRLKYKLNYFTLMGVMAGSVTDPPALAYSNTTAGNDAPAVGYATVYPLTMFLRVLAAQLLILFFA